MDHRSGVCRHGFSSRDRSRSREAPHSWLDAQEVDRRARFARERAHSEKHAREAPHVDKSRDEIENRFQRCAAGPYKFGGIRCDLKSFGGGRDLDRGWGSSKLYSTGTLDVPKERQREGGGSQKSKEEADSASAVRREEMRVAGDGRAWGERRACDKRYDRHGEYGRGDERSRSRERERGQGTDSRRVKASDLRAVRPPLRSGDTRSMFTSQCKFMFKGRVLGAGKGEKLTESSIDRIFNNIISKYLKEKDPLTGISRLCNLVHEGDNIQNMNKIHVSCAIDTLGKLLSNPRVDCLTKSTSKGISGLPSSLDGTVLALAERFIAIMQKSDVSQDNRSLSAVLHGLALMRIAGISKIASNMAIKQALFQRVSDVTEHLGHWDITQVVWSSAKLGWFMSTDADLFSRIDVRCCHLFDIMSIECKFDGVDTANMLQALALIQNASGLMASNAWLERLEWCAGIEAPTLSPQGVVTTVTGLAKLERSCHTWVKFRICARAVEIMHEGKSQDVANLMWGMAKMGWEPPGHLFDILYARMMELKSSFNTEEMIRVWWSTAMMNVRLGPGMEHWECMISRLNEMANEFNAQDMSMFFHGLTLMNHAPGPIMTRIVNRLPRTLDDSLPQNVAQIIQGLTHMQELGLDIVTDELLDVLSHRSCVLMKSFNGQDLSAVYWAFATLKRTPGLQLMESMTRRLISILHELNARDVSNIAWAFQAGKWHQTDDDEEEEEELHTGHMCALRASLLQAPVNSVYDPTSVIGALAKRSQDLIECFQPRDFANLFWALEKLVWRNPENVVYTDFFMTLCDGLADQAQAIRQGKRGPLLAQDIVQILHAISTNYVFLNENICDREIFNSLLKDLAEMCIDLIPSFNVTDITGVCYAAVQLDWSGSVQSRLMDSLLSRSYDLAAQLDGRCLSDLVWAIARTRRELSPDLMRMVSSRVIELLDSQSAACRPRDVASLMWSLGKLGARPSLQLRMRLAIFITSNIEHLKSWHLTHILWATASTPPHATPPNSQESNAECILHKCIIKKLSERMGQFRASSVTTILWALVVISVEPGFQDLYSDEIFCSHLRHVAKGFALRIEHVFSLMEADEGEVGGDGQVRRAASPRRRCSRIEHEFDRSDMCMIHQFFLSCALDARFGKAIRADDSDMQRVRRRYEKRCQQAFEETLSASSDMQKRVSEVLAHMKLDVQAEYRCCRSGYSVDLLVHFLLRLRALSRFSLCILVL
jgi:hypothetical protein